MSMMESTFPSQILNISKLNLGSQLQHFLTLTNKSNWEKPRRTKLPTLDSVAKIQWFVHSFIFMVLRKTFKA